MDDFDIGSTESAGLSLAAVMSNAAPVHDNQLSSLSLRSYIPSVTEDRYMKATPEQVDFNMGVTMNENNAVAQVLDLLDVTGLERKKEVVFIGNVDQDSAKKLASTLVK